MRTPYAGKRYEYSSSAHKRALARALEYYEHSVQGKREIEREGLLATKHLSSFLDEKKHPWSTKVYDPIFHGAVQARVGKVAEAFFSNPPLYSFEPEEDTPWEKAEAMTRACELHEQQVVSETRQGVLQGFAGQASVGTQCWAMPWVFRQGEVGHWVKSDLKASFIDPITGQRQRVVVPGAGPERRERVLTTLQDGPMAIPKHITQWGCDTSHPNPQRGEWFYERDTISAREGRDRIKSDNWDRKGVEEAIKGDIPPAASDGMRDALDWFEEIGLVCSKLKAGLELTKEAGRKVLEVIELYYRDKLSIRRQVILNRSYIVWDDVSPYDHGLFPYIISRNYAMLGQFWGLSDYRIARYLIRGIQQMRNAVVNEASWRANPPALYNDMLKFQMRYEPRALIPVNGDPSGIRFLEGAGQSLADGSAVANMMQERLDAGLGSNEQARGAPGRSGTTATAVQAALQGVGIRDKLQIEDFADGHVVPRGEMTRLLIEQHETRKLYWREGPKADPVEIYPEDFRGGRMRPVAKVNTDPMRQIQVKRLLDLYNLAAQHQEPHLKRESLVEGLLEQMTPDLKARVFKSQEELDQEQQPAPVEHQVPGQMGGPAQRTGQYQSPYPGGGAEEMGAMMAEAL